MRNTSDKKRSSSQSVDNSSLIPQKKKLKGGLPPPSTPSGTATSSSEKSDFKGVEAYLTEATEKELIGLLSFIVVADKDGNTWPH